MLHRHFKNKFIHSILYTHSFDYLLWISIRSILVHYPLHLLYLAVYPRSTPIPCSYFDFQSKLHSSSPSSFAPYRTSLSTRPIHWPRSSAYSTSHHLAADSIAIPSTLQLQEKLSFPFTYCGVWISICSNQHDLPICPSLSSYNYTYRPSSSTCLLTVATSLCHLLIYLDNTYRLPFSIYLIPMPSFLRLDLRHLCQPSPIKSFLSCLLL